MLAKLHIPTVVFACLVAISLAPPLSGQNLIVEIDQSTKLRPDGKTVEFEVKTNLPAGTQLLVMLQPKELVFQSDPSGDAPPPGSLSGTGLGKPVVTKSGVIKDKMEIQGPVKTGDYLLRVQATISPANQQAGVLQVIGDHGENLRGPLVRYVSDHGSIVVKETTVQFRSDKVDKVPRRVRRQYAKALKQYKEAFEAFKEIRQSENSLSATARIKLYFTWAYRLGDVHKAVEQFESQAAIAQFRPVWHSLDRLRRHSIGRRNEEYEKAVEDYNRELEKAYAFLNGIK